jgi:hypothetical protein
MKTRLLLIALILGIFTMLFFRAPGVMAVGAPSDNMTVPGFTGVDESQGEIPPVVEYTLLGPSLQAEETPPAILPVFTAASGQGGFNITGNETWYLDIDVNTDGWIYIYESYPEGAEPPGRYITYKWQLPQSGIWRFGPFITADNEAEGQHIYHIWFYSNGQWAGDNGPDSQGTLVNWTYTRNTSAAEPAPVTSPPPPAQPEQETFFDKLLNFFSQPLVWSLSLLVLVVVVLGGFYYYWRYRRNVVTEEPEPANVPEPELEETPQPLTAKVNARILLPNNTEIKLDGGSRIIGRDDLARALSMDKLILISRKHFKVQVQDEQFFIEDLGSANGTTVNGTDISNSGSVSIKDDDVIGLAGTVDLRFNVL